MADLEKYSDVVWDRFFDFAFSGEEQISHGEVEEKLKKLGIDLSKAMSRVQQALESVRAREALAVAKAKRPGLVESMRSIVAEAAGGLREKVRQVIERKLQGGVQAAYFRKLEAAATDEDLQALLEDMCRVEALEKEQDDGKAEHQ
jgi:hypothetical protein